MKSFKNIALSAVLAMGAFSAVTYTACTKDECKDVVCNNGGTCVSGNCNCPTGYEGEKCDTRSNTKFAGTYNAEETCGGTNSPAYQVTITASASNPTQVLINNLGNYGCSIGGTITFNGSVNAAQLTVNDTKCGYAMSATGNYSNGVLTIQYSAVYTVNGSTTTDNCTATLTKQ